jgi:uncharacterized membrane protein YvbJ
MKNMFCPNCGADDQTADAYCKRCGEWLPDIAALAKPGLFRKASRDEKIRKMRILEAVSAGLSLTSAAIIISVLATGRNVEMLFLAAICGVVVAVHQIINFYLGYKTQHKIAESRSDIADNIKVMDEKRPLEINSADMTPFIDVPSVVENTTELLEPVPRGEKSGKNK